MGKTDAFFTTHRPSAGEEQGTPIPLDPFGEDRAQALAAYAAGVNAEAAGESVRALDLYSIAIRHDPSLVDLGVRVAAEFLKRNNGDRSLQLLAGLIQAHPKDAALHCALALTHSVLGHAQEARRCANAAIVCDPGNASAHALLFDLDTSQRTPAQLDPALAQLRKRGGTLSDTTEFWESVGEAYARLLTERDKLSVPAIAHLSLPLFETSLSYAPNDVVRLVRVGDLLTLEKRHAEAASLFQRGIYLDPSHADLPSKLALAYLSAGKTAEAITTLEELVKNHPERNPLYAVLAELYGQDGNPAMARHYRTEAEKRGADPLLLAELCLRDKEWAEGERLLVLAQQRPGAAPSAWFRLAQLHLRQEKPDEARATMAQALERFPDSARVALVASAVARDTKQFAPAEAHMARAEELARSYDPELLKEDLYFEWGVLAEQSGDLNAAERRFRQAIAENPAHHRAMNYLSYSWADRAVRLPEALLLVQSALKLEPNNAAYLDTLGWIYFRMNRYQEALSTLDAALAQGGDDAEIHEHRGDVLARMGRRADAVAAWRRAAQQDPQRQSIRNKLEQQNQP